MMWENIDQAKQRLQGTVVFHKDFGPVYVSSVEPDNKTRIKHLHVLPDRGKQSRRFGAVNSKADLRDDESYCKWEDLSHKGLPLGWTSTFNYANKPYLVAYASRIPYRGVKAGLCSDNLKVLAPNSNPISFTNTVGYNLITQCMVELYPSLKEAIEFSIEREVVVPISNSVAVLSESGWPTFLYFKNKKAGFSTDNSVFTLPESNAYLQETLHEQGLKTKVA